MHSSPETFAVIEKEMGETPLAALERFREVSGIPESTPLAYAGRLDPMASGKLIILIGDECKKQEEYHGLDKEYEFEVLFGASSDSGDVLGIIETCAVSNIPNELIQPITKNLHGNIELPYPHFSSKTVQGKPLHMWTLEGKLGEIEIPLKHSRIYTLDLVGIKEMAKQEIYDYASQKIELIPPVTDPRKTLGADFRRDDVRIAWKLFLERGLATYQVATFRCVASSGTYMRSLAEIIATKLGTCGLAFHIHRTNIGRYTPIIGSLGFWRRKF